MFGAVSGAELWWGHGVDNGGENGRNWPASREEDDTRKRRKTGAARGERLAASGVGGFGRGVERTITVMLSCDMSHIYLSPSLLREYPAILREC
jgi:hypothetical protein